MRWTYTTPDGATHVERTIDDPPQPGDEHEHEWQSTYVDPVERCWCGETRDKD